ncbi:hypothetical protein RAE03_10455 [Corynebacterium tuberculostearicum]|uniref:Uncharacterized protein n=1 Tax=Corynebacterium tuberculostearicum TaxID=38304 RepID=A0AAE4NN22_9CORY|nr:hypothetical protein [Corynebacterium tuberculostearicum]MDV2420183.1 hypothetical protein [Corynebacterium tuberculostearicum]
MPNTTPPSLEEQLQTAVRQDEIDLMTEIPACEVIELTALCRIADALTTISTHITKEN